MYRILLLLAIAPSIAFSQAPPPEFDVLIKGGMVYDGTGAEPRRADVAIKGDRVAGVGDFASAKARTVIKADGMAVAPGFINMLSWSNESLIADGRSQSEIRQGVTTEIMGEGQSMGPLNEAMKKRMLDEQKDIKYEIKWNTLAEYLRYLETRGVSCNVASFIGAATIREYVIGLEDKQPTPEQLEKMRALVQKEMEAGALGIGSSLIYPPAFYAKTEELIELCKVAAKYRGKYISHMRSEGNHLLEALDELIRISREAAIPAEIYHLKAAGKDNWAKEDRVAGADRSRAKGRAQDHGRHVQLRRRGHRTRRLAAAVDRRRRLSRAFQAPARSGDAREDRGASAHAEQRMGEPVSRRRFARADSARRFQVGEVEAAHRQIARGSGEAAREGSGRDDHGLDQ